jgi:hypothetical protein
MVAPDLCAALGMEEAVKPLGRTNRLIALRNRGFG